MQIFEVKNNIKSRVIKEFRNVLFLCILGLIFRTILFGDIPPGLNQDEAAAGYEAYSLLLTGKDKWGNIWPGYFIAWGAGQNVLYSYLLIPVIHFFGFTVQSVRSVNLIFGILTIPLLYWFVKKTVSRKVAFICTLLLAISPWHIMMSRWGLESNLLPFFLLLGFCSVYAALTPSSSFWQVSFCLLPWAIALYSYATFYFIIPVLFFLLLKTYKERVVYRKRAWISAFIIFLFVSFPVILFVAKNSLFRSNLFFENYLPFSVPLLTGTPLRGVNPQSNLEFILNGFQDNNIWNHIPGVPPFFMIAFPFLCIGIHILRKSKANHASSLFLVWFISCVPLLFFSSLNINRANSIFIPAIVISVIGFDVFIKKINDDKYRRIFKKVIVYWVLFSSLLFITNYFFFYSEKAYDAFNYGLESAFTEAKLKAKGDEGILITKQIRLPYVYILFLDEYSPSEFQKTSVHQIDKDGAFDVLHFGKYYFDRGYLRKTKPKESFVYVQRITEESFCVKPTIFYQKNKWRVGQCDYDPIDEKSVLPEINLK